MAKSFKLRLTRIIHTTFQSCRSKDSSALPHDPLPSSYICFSSVNPKFLPLDDYPPVSQPRSESLHHHCSDGGRRKDSRDFTWREEEKWHVVAKVYEEGQKPRRKIYNSSASGDSGEDEVSALPLPLAAERRTRRGKVKKTKIPTRHHRTSTSSAESGLFSNEEEEEESLETETLVSSSRSFSTDSSSEYIPQLETIREKSSRPHHHKRGKKKAKKRRSVSRTIYRPSSVSVSENESPARLSVFQKLIPCSVEGKVKESFAVIKKSEDPYEDFKRSMMEMILEKQMFEETDLEQLLQCFLSLNARDHHRLIVQAFVEIWEAMFCASDDRNSGRHPRTTAVRV